MAEGNAGVFWASKVDLVTFNSIKENFQKDSSHQWHLGLSRWGAGTVESVGKEARVLRELDSIGYFRVTLTHTSCIYTFLKLTLWWLLDVS